MVLVIIFSSRLMRLPATGAGPDGSTTWAWDFEHIQYLIMPAVTMSFIPIGASVVGKTCTDERAFSLNGKNAHFGTPRNGAAPLRIPGGSSSGSAAAVSNGLADLALGTDTGGSVRGPASHCGLIGLRPSHARISLQGTMELAHDVDTCGSFARDIHIFQRVGAVLLGKDSQPLPEAPQVLLAADVLALLSGRVQDVFNATVAALAALLGPVTPVAAFGIIL